MVTVTTGFSIHEEAQKEGKTYDAVTGISQNNTAQSSGLDLSCEWIKMA